MVDRAPFFSVIIATRNRPALFRQALESVLEQTCQDVEVVVVNDGSSVEHGESYAAILDTTRSPRLRSFTLVPRTNGHGQSYALNFGAAVANADYLCFLDDDDRWTDPEHLRRAQAVIAEASAPVDLYMSNQAAFLHEAERPGPMWLADLPPILAKAASRADRHGVYTVGVGELLQSLGFCHLNTLIVRRALYQEIGGMDETIRWECDHDLYFRLVDHAAVIRYFPGTVSRHNIPDPAKSASMTTTLSEVERRLFQVRVFDRAALFTRHPAIRAHGRRHKAYTLKRITLCLAAEGRHVEAAFFAREALGAGPNLRWAAYTAWRTVRALAGSRTKVCGPPRPRMR